MRIFYILILILVPINAQADEKWDFAKLDGFTYGALAGEVTHGDKLRFIMRKDHCDTVQHIVTFYTYQKPNDISQLKGQKNSKCKLMTFLVLKLKRLWFVRF